MLARKVIVFGSSVESGNELAKKIEEVYFYNVNNRDFLRCGMKDIEEVKYYIDLVALLERICVEGLTYEMMDDRDGSMIVATPLRWADVTKDVMALVMEIRALRYELKKLSISLRVAVGDHYLTLDQTTAPTIINNSPCSGIMDSRRAQLLKLNEKYQELHQWWDPLITRRGCDEQDSAQ